MPTKSSASRTDPICHTALDDARALLQYWQTEQIKSVASGDQLRAAQCKSFVEHCQSVVAALEEAS
ncbi:MAG: hypothetical protein V4637_13345 [Pseudomonadota bacterium]